MGKVWRRGLLVLLAAAALAGTLWGGYRYLEKDYIFWNLRLLPRNSQSLDISGSRMGNPETLLKCTDLRQLDARGTEMTLAQYEWLRRELPDCQVLWDVPIQGNFYSTDTEELYVQALTGEEADSLQYLPELKLVDVAGWEDYPRIQALRQQYPDCTIRYRVNIAGEWWDSDVVSLLLENADPEELSRKLVWFENLESVLLTGQIPALEQLKALQEQYPDIFFLWKMEALGMTLETDMAELTLSEGSLETVRTLEALLPYFPQLERIVLNPSDPAREVLLALAKAYPDIQFVFDIAFGDYVYSTDAEEIDLSNTPLEDTAPVEAIVPLFHNLKKVVMCNCGLSSEEMDDLNQKYPEIRFVWSVNLGGVMFRTDAVHFAPNRWGLKLTNENIYDLRYCTDMVCVDIGHNMHVTNCEWVKFMPKLKYLVLAETGISDLSPLEGHESLIFLELFLSRVKDYSILTTCKALEDLNLCYTQGDPAPIGEMTWLKRLWWSGCWAGRVYLADKLPNTEKQFLSLSSTGKGWREGQNYYDMRDFIGMEYMTG